MRLDDRSWLLFLYLVHRVPGQALARVLIEGDFLPNLDACMRDGDHAPGLVPANSDEPEPPRSTSRAKTRKRKRDESGRAVIEDNDQRSTPDSFPELFAACLCAAIKHCMEYFTANVDHVSSEHIRIALAAPVRMAASATSRLISKFVTLLSHSPSGPLEASTLFEYAPGLLGLWECRTKEDANTLAADSDREFTDQCLSPCLAFLKALQTSHTVAEGGRIVKKIEQLIALHTVLPARAKFLAQRPDRIVDTGGHSSGIDSISVSENLGPLLFDVAVRTMPRNTIRRQQHEQPWLDALFSRIAALCGESGLQELLKVVITRKIALAQDELAKLALQQISNVSLRWPLLVQILQIDASVLFKSSSPLMERLCDCISESGEQEYALIHESVVITSMKAAGQTRELQDFVHIWHGRLSEAIQEYSSSSEWRGSRVWQDLNVFAAFEDVMGTNATPPFVYKLLRDSLEHLRKFGTDEQAMFAALAWTAIISSVVTSRRKYCATEPDILRQLLEAAVSAYAHLQCPKSQRWRLIRLARQILSILPEEEGAVELLPFLANDQIRRPSLGNRKEMEEQQEVIEYFHLLVCRAITQPSTYQELLQKEFEHLAALLQGLCDQSIDYSFSGLADQSLGIILQNPEVLLLTPMERVWPALWRYAATSESVTSQRLFQALVSSDTVTSNSALLSQCFQVIQDSIGGDEAHQSLFAYQILLSMPCQIIRRNQERMRLVKRLEEAGVARVAQDLTLMPSKSEANPPFQELKSLASAIKTHSAGRLRILEADSFERFCLELDHTRLTLDTPNQFVIDDLLSTLTLLTAPCAPTFSSMPPNGASAIYQRLCTLTSLLLTRHRKRLGGRYHLLLPVLQGLLRCLFRPIPIPASSKQPQIRHHHPPWLTTNPRTTTEPLTLKSATQFTRILTSLCDPTASSVKHSRRSAAGGLTDDTKKARSISGQYMQYLIMEYARCQLQGQLPPEVKAALTPGLYAVLDVMSRELMRGMNAAMDSSSRAIFKGLYADYQRFGRWNQN